MLRRLALFAVLFVSGCSALSRETRSPVRASTLTVSFSIDRDRLDDETVASLEKVASLLGTRGQVKSTHVFTVASRTSGSYADGFKGTRRAAVVAERVTTAPGRLVADGAPAELAAETR